MSEFEIYLHGEGNYTESYTKLGAHFTTIDEVGGVSFAVWAPNAQRIGVIGPFNGWDNRVHPMERRGDSGIWELFIPNLVEGTPYKFAIKSLVMGYEVDKSDPYAYYADMRPGTESRIWDIQKYVWDDGQWMDDDLIARRWTSRSTSTRSIWAAGSVCPRPTASSTTAIWPMTWPPIAARWATPTSS